MICHYCRAAPGDTWDHVVPKKLGGDNAVENLVRSCGPCNQAKADSWPTCICGYCEAARVRWAEIHPYSIYSQMFVTLPEQVQIPNWMP